jgi:PAS domain-containing protein
MAQKEIEVILTRQLASYLAMPVFIVDRLGTLTFYNEPAERILGHRYEETGEMLSREWSTIFRPTDDGGAPMGLDQLPQMVALTEQRPIHRAFWILGLDQVRRRIEVTALPLRGLAGRNLGVLAFFWESPR